MEEVRERLAVNKQTNWLEANPSRQTASCATIKDRPGILWNTEDYFYVSLTTGAYPKPDKCGSYHYITFSRDRPNIMNRPEILTNN
jgi:hypothetical protein